MKILFLTDNFPPEVNAPATRTYEHCREWVKAGVEVTVITCFPNFPMGKLFLGYKNHCRKTEWIDGIRVIRVWSYITPNLGFSKRILDYISFSISSFLVGLFVKTDVIVATSPQFFTALSGRTLALWKRKPWIMEVRDLWPESIISVGAMSHNYFIRYFEKEEIWCYRSATKIVTVTDSFKREIIKKGIPATKIDVVKNGANFDLYNPKPKNECLLKELGLEGKIVLGYIGTHGMAHKLDFILDCAKRMKETHPSIHFIFLGDGAEKDNLLKQVELDELTNVTLLGSVPKKDVVDFLSILDAAIINLRKSDLFKTVIPSKIFETTAMQVPILLGVDGEARGIVEKYNVGLYYEPENENDFIEKVELLFSAQTDIQAIKEGCYKLSHDFDRKKLSVKMLNLIEAVASKKN